jgi:hypothetical protein
MIAYERSASTDADDQGFRAGLRVLLGPVVLTAYIFGLWGLTANIGITNAFPWSAGPFSNWIVWIVSGLLLHIGARSLQKSGELLH